MPESRLVKGLVDLLAQCTLVKWKSRLTDKQIRYPRGHNFQTFYHGDTVPLACKLEYHNYGILTKNISYQGCQKEYK